MRNIVFLLVVILIITSNVGFAQEARTVGEKLAFDILLDSYSKGENALISPYSLYTALSMAACGAKGETQEQILTALGADAPANIAISGAVTANAAFIASDAGATDEYIQKLSQFAARVFPADTISVDDVNSWAKEATNGLIDLLLTQPLDENTKLVLLNAISMQAKWQMPFKSASTSDRTFHAADGDIEIPFMTGTIDMLYGERDGLQMGVLPYSDVNLNAYLILPEKDGMENALQALISEGYDLFDGINAGSVRIFLPKIDISGDMKLSKALISLGVSDAFSYGADFSAINGKTDLMIDEVMQKALLKVDEDGTEAAAATGVTMVPKGILPMADDSRLFRLDRPFIMLVRDEASGQTLFCACMEKPNAAKGN